MKKFLTSKIGNILLCIAEIIVGVLLLVNPDAVTSAFIIGAGAVMILTGVVFCTLYFVGEAEKMVIKQLLFKGLLLIILGVLCVTQYGVLLAALILRMTVYKDSLFMNYLTSLLLGLACAVLFYTRRFRNTQKDGKLYNVVSVVLAIMALIYGIMGLAGLLSYFGIL